MKPVPEALLGSDYPIRLQFPSRRVRRRRWQRGNLVYETQIYRDMPPKLCAPYGLERQWGFRLQSSHEVTVFIQMKPERYGRSPALAVGAILPCLTFPVPLQARGGMAIALIKFDEEVDLVEREGRITLFLEKTQQGDNHPVVA